jgi:glyoxylase I family protein
VEKVPGIGGLFFRARDPVALARWYAEQLGIALTPANYDEQPWHQAAGPTAFTPFPELREAGMEVEVDSEAYPNGRFARLHDPEGNPIELWEPQGR